MKNKTLIEICVDSVESAIAAEKGGADRIELCDNLFEGGTTPSAATIELAKKYVNINVNVIIRPRGGDFLYSRIEFETMKRDVLIAKDSGADGLVFGILTSDGFIDKERNAELLSLSRPLPVTFHRAFDKSSDPFKSLNDLINLGIDRLLTSGQEQSAFEGADLISKLLKKAEGKIIIIPGGGINENNILKIISLTGAKECHLTGKKKIPSQMKYKNNRVLMRGSNELSEYEILMADQDRIRKIKEIINK